MCRCHVLLLSSLMAPAVMAAGAAVLAQSLQAPPAAPALDGPLPETLAWPSMIHKQGKVPGNGSSDVH